MFLKHSNGRFLVQALAIIGLAVQLNACIPVVAGGVATTGAMVSDRRSSGTFIDDDGKNTIEFGIISVVLGTPFITFLKCS